jgi:hypothetical protein
MASSGLLTTIRMACGEWRTASVTTCRMIFMFVARRSSRLIPGFRAMPAVTMTMSEPAESA